MNDNILLFSSKWGIIRTIGMVDPSKQKLQNLDLHYRWLYTSLTKEVHLLFCFNS